MQKLVILPCLILFVFQLFVSCNTGKTKTNATTIQDSIEHKELANLVNFSKRDEYHESILAQDLPLAQTIEFENILSGDFESENPLHSKVHFKQGKQSLQWAWNQPNSSLTFKTSIAYKEKFRDYSKPVSQVSVFRAWVYNSIKQPEEKLSLSFGIDDQVQCYFEYGLNFTGWRLIAFKYDDMDGNPTSNMNFIRIQASNTSTKGIVYFDQIKPVSYDDFRWIWSDYQTKNFTPDIINTLYINTPEMQRDAQQAMEPEMIQQVQKLKDNVYKTLDLPDSENNAKIQDLISFYNSLQINADDLSIRGRAIEGETIRKYLENYLEIAKQYTVASATNKQKLCDIFIKMTIHLLDQGWAEGSAIGAQPLFGYKSRSWAPAMLIMEKELKQAGLLRESLMAHIWMGREFTDFTAPYEELTPVTKQLLANRLADYLNTFSNAHLVCLLLLEDNMAKYKTLSYFSDFISRIILWENAALKPDGSFFHHEMHYAGYSLPAISHLSKVISALDGSPFEISLEAYSKLRDSVYMTYVWGYPHYSFNAFGRHPLSGSIEDYPVDDFLRIANSSPQSDKPDEKIMNIIDIVWGSNKDQVKTVSQLPQGFWSMNYNASGIHKWKDYSIITKGYNRYVRSHETYKKDNRYGRYASHGTVILTKIDAPNSSGLQYDGWNWSMPTGATTLMLPPDTLEGDANAFYGKNPRQVTSFSGSSHLQSKYGIFAFQLDGLREEESLQVRKSVYFIGKHIICLGSNLSNKSEKYPLVTTLFQQGLEGVSKPVNSFDTGKIKNEIFQAEYIVTDAKKPWFIDTLNCGYVVYENSGKIRFQKGLQQSKHDKTKETTHGRFSTLWLDHGIGSKDAQYDYSIFLDTNSIEMQNIASSEKPYQVLRKDQHVHAIHYPSENITAYTFFTSSENRPSNILNQPNPKLSADRDSLVIVKENKESVSLSVCYPEVQIKRNFNQAATIKKMHIRIIGLYDIVEKNQESSVLIHDQDHTLIELYVLDGQPTNLLLKRK